MAAKRKPDQLNRQASPSKSGSNQQNHNNPLIAKYQSWLLTMVLFSDLAIWANLLLLIFLLGMGVAR
jgi:hypothetical protein